jgi:uncharacterized membrane protein YbhN (UPF0104 family)
VRFSDFPGIGFAFSTQRLTGSTLIFIEPQRPRKDVLSEFECESALRVKLLSSGIRTVIMYAVAIGVVCYVARGISPQELLRNFSKAHLLIFLPASAGSFAVWFLGETFLFATLFSLFHSRTSFREILPANAAQYFLQLVNTAVAGTALVVFMNRRKGATWLSAGWTLIFQALLDLQIMAAMALVVAAADSSSIIRRFWQFPGLILAVLTLNMWFWLRGRPASSIGQWIYDRPSLNTFRVARLSHYFHLAVIRTAIFLGYGLMLYFQLRGFQVPVSASSVLSLLPVVLLVDGLPITPVGMGPVQVILVSGFAAFAPRPQLLAMALSVSFMCVAFQAPLGFFFATTFPPESPSSFPIGITEAR